MRIIFAGTPEFAVPSLQALLNSEHQICAVYTQPDRPAGRGRKLSASPVKELALQAGLEVFQPESLKKPEEVARLQAFEADLMVVVAYGMILPQTVLDVPKFGCINVHGSLLPKWRGAAPIQRSIMAGDAETGVTIMQVVLKLDAGPMLHKERLPLSGNDTSSLVYEKLAHLGAIGLTKVLQQMDAGTLQIEPQDESLVTYAEKLTKNEAILDWTQPATVLAHKVLGLNAWPVAQTMFNGEVLRIWQANVDAASVDRDPGMVRVEDGRVLVATGEGWLNLLEVQLPGGKRMAIQAFLNAHTMDGVALG